MAHPRPNILLIVADDHAPAALSAYGSRLIRTPHLDQLAAEGMRFDNCFCTNALCTPARASILTGKYSHQTGVKTLNDSIDQTKHATAAMLLHAAGYRTAFVGKWHLGHGPDHDPAGFDDWAVLPNQGKYVDPDLLEPGGKRMIPGYVTDVLTDWALDWLARQTKEQPFFLVCAHKAPHDPFVPPSSHLQLYAEQTVPEPPTFHDDLRGRDAVVRMSTAQVDRMHRKNHLPDSAPPGLSPAEQKAWNYQSFIKNYLRCVAGLDDSVGRILAYLDAEGLADDTLVIYTSDHGFFLGDHGWYDKRLMDEPSIRIPLLIRYPRRIAPGMSSDRMALNVDFAPTLLELADVPVPTDMQGRSLRPLWEGAPPADWRTDFYYRYWMHLAHFDIPAHYGIRTEQYKLVFYYGEALGCAGTIDCSTPPTWEFFDLETDPHETTNRVDDPAYAPIVAQMRARLALLQRELGDTE